MKKIVVFVLGPDQPGIIAAVSKALFEQNCNLEDVSQTILQSAFVAIIIASMQDSQTEKEVLAALEQKTKPLGLFVHLRPMHAHIVHEQPASESFVITTIGPDRAGLVAGITEILAQYKVNITNLKAVFRGDPDPLHNIMYYEVDIPSSQDHRILRDALFERAHQLGLDITIQHREIFEQIHRI
ncbi:MAG: ACT domain-containing protein [Nitrospirota bacterium]